MSDFSGHVIRGYRLVSRLGTGGFGEVYRAYQQSVDREVAVKLILPEFANLPDFIRRFENEAQVIARLENPFIVPLFDYWRDPSGAYLIMRLLRGGNLEKALEKRPLDVQAAARLLEQIAAALAVAHRNGIVHRDIKPANILLDEDGNAYLADFGIAKNIRVTNDSSESEVIIGSPAYLSPEQIRSDPVTPQSDIYSLGLVLYEVLAGEKPFSSTTPISELIHNQLHDTLPSLHSLRPDLPRALDTILQTATSKTPAHRYADAIRFAAAFRAAITATPGGPIQPLQEPLTPRELDILRLMVEGLSNQEIAQKLYLSAGTVKWYVKQIFGKLDAHRRLEAVMRAIDLRLVEDKNAVELSPDSPVATPQTVHDYSTIVDRIIPHEEVENPYKGLRAFQEADAPDFFGRNMLVGSLIARMAETGEFSRFLAVVGPSGSGKSSVVKAGLLPALRQGALSDSHNWFYAEMLPSSQPLLKLEAALLSQAANRPAHLMQQLRADPRGLLWVVDHLLADIQGDLLLVIDQFEEIYTLVEDEVERAQFLDLLYTAVTDPHSRLRVVITLRADFYDRPLLYERFGTLIQARTQVVLPLNANEIERAVNGPAQRVGIPVDTELIAAVVADVREEPGALPLLQYALTETFDRRDGTRLTLSDYRASGGVLGALAHRAEEVYLALEGGQPFAAQQVFLRLVTLGEGTEDTRRRVRLSEVNGLASADLIQVVLEKYSQCRLLTFDREIVTREPTVEVAHEALLREWGRLREWLDSSRTDVRAQRQLADDASEWEKAGRDESFLLSGTKLLQFEEWVSTTNVALTSAERSYFEASLARRAQLEQAEALRRAHDEAIARRVQNFQRTTIVMAIVGVFALLAAILGANIAGTAKAQFEVAYRSQLTAVSAQETAQEQASAASSAAADALNSAATATIAQGDALLAQGTAIAQANQANVAATNAINSAATATVAQGQAQAQAAGARAEVSQAAETLTPAHSTLVAGATQISAAQAQVTNLGATLTSIPSTLTPVQLTIQAGSNLIATANDRVSIANDELATALTQVAQSGATLTPLPLTLTPAQLTLVAGHEQVLAAQGTAQSAAGTAEHAEIRANTASTAVAFAGQTLTPIHATLQAGATQIGNAQTEVAFVGQTLTPVAPTLTAVAIEIQDQQSHIESLRLAGAANSELLDNGDASLAVLLAIRALNTAYSSQADGALAQAIERLSTEQRFIGHTSWVLSVAFSPDGTLILTGSNDGTARVWDVATNRELIRFTGHRRAVNSVAFSPDGTRAITGSDDRTVRLWDTATGEELHSFPALRGEVKAVAFSPDGSYVAAGGNDHNVHIWDIETDTERVLEGHTDSVRSIAFSPDGSLILTGSSDGTATLWDAQTGVWLRSFVGHTDDVWSAAFSPDGSQILTASWDNTARLWDVSTGQLLHIFAGHDDDVWSAVFSPDGSQILTGSKDDKVILWDVKSGEIMRIFSDPDIDFVNSAVFSPNGTRVLSGSDDDVVRLWNVAANQTLPVYAGNHSVVTSVAIAPDDSFVVTGHSDSTAIVWNAATAEQLHSLEAHTDGVTSVAVAPDASALVTGSQDYTAIIWDVTTGEPSHILSGHDSVVTSVAYSPDGAFVLTGSEDKTAILWNASTGERIRVFSGAESPISSVAFSPDGSLIVTGSWDHHARIWNVQSGRIVRTLRGHSNYVTSVTFSPDGSQILTGSRDRTARLWNTETGEEIHIIAGHSGWVTSVAFSPDGSQILTGSRDRTVLLWNSASFELERRFAGTNSPVTSLAFSSDGKTALTGNEDGVARLWYVDWHAMVDYACTLMLRDLSTRERQEFIDGDRSLTCP